MKLKELLAGLDILSSSATRPERIPVDFTFINFNIEFFCFWKNCYRCSRSVYSTLCFGCRDTLHPMYTGFVF